MTTAKSDNRTTDAVQMPNVIVKSGNPMIGIVLAVLVGLGAFFAGMQFEGSKRADYTVRVEGIPQSLPVVGVPEAIRIEGAIQGIPEIVRFQGSVGGIPEDITVETVPIANANPEAGHIIVTPNGGVYHVFNFAGVWRAVTIVSPPRPPLPPLNLFGDPPK